MTQALIDSDILLYEIGFSGEYDEVDENTGEKVHHIREWDFVQELLDNKIKFICDEVEATMPPKLYMTGSKSTANILGCEYVEPIRNIIAITKPYKATRKAEKPFHFHNIAAYLIANYDCTVAWGLEADDLMCIEQWSRREKGDTIICSRDKDLKMCPGLQFSWECGKQPSFGPELVDNKGWIKLANDRKSIKGTGLKFFFSQMLTGDTVDNIPGCSNTGPVKAFNILSQCSTKKEHEDAIIEAYKEGYGDVWQEMLEEQSKLLWMVRELSADGQPIHYEWKY